MWQVSASSGRRYVAGVSKYREAVCARCQQVAGGGMWQVSASSGRRYVAGVSK